MRSLVVLSDLHCEELAGGYGYSYGGIKITEYTKNSTRIGQKNNAANVVVGVAYKASSVLNAASIENLQANSVG